MFRIAILAFVVLTFGCTGGAARFNGVDPTADVLGTNDETVEILKARIAASNAHDFAAWEALHTEDCTRTAPELTAPLQGRAEMRAAIERLVRAFPDYHVALVRAVASGPWIAAELKAWGTMEHSLERPGKFFSIPPSGKSFEQTWTAFIRFDHGRIAEIRETYDQTDLNDQLIGSTRPKPW